MRKLLLLLIVGLSTCAFAQKWEITAPEEAKAVLMKMGEQHRMANYKLTFDFNFYRDVKDSIPLMTDKGRFVRGSGNCYRSERTGELVIQTEAMRMVVDSNNRLVVLTKPDTLFKVIDIQSYTKAINWANYICTRMTTAKETRYELAPKTPGEIALQLWVDKKTGELIHVELLLPKGNYSSQEMNDASQEMPRIVMNYSIPAAYNRPAEFDLGTWLTPLGSHFKLNPSMPEDYRLEDLRTPPTH